MKNKLTLALVALCLICAAGVSQAGPGPIGPFPGHTLAIPFPWSTINGIWQTNDQSTNTRFKFQVLRDQKGMMILGVSQFDARTGAVLATGTGYQSASNPNTVFVQMRSQYGGPEFEVVLQSYTVVETGERFNVMSVGDIPKGQTLNNYDILMRSNGRAP